jgi:hypothetical protein
MSAKLRSEADGRSADHAERDADLPKQIDPLVVQPNLHDQDAVDEVLADELLELADGVDLHRPQDQVVGVFLGGLGRAGDELEFGRAEAAGQSREEQGDDPASLARQPSRQCVGLVAEIGHRLPDPLRRVSSETGRVPFRA